MGTQIHQDGNTYRTSDLYYAAYLKVAGILLSGNCRMLSGILLSGLFSVFPFLSSGTILSFDILTTEQGSNV